MVVEVIPYRTFKERIRIVKEEERKDRYIEVWNKHRLIYSCEKRREKNGKQ